MLPLIFCYPYNFAAQNENSKWYFGTNGGLNFLTTPPTPIAGSALTTIAGCASISDANGNILFYTDGVTVYNSTNSIMTNGTGLLGDYTPYQPCLIVKKPGSQTIYYIFTVQGNGYAGGLRYSIVDMSLSGGLGAVTIKNIPIYPFACTESVGGTWHCNGTDYWIVVHELNGSAFRAYQVSAAGVNTTAVISSVGPQIINGNINMAMKFTESANKLAMITHPIVAMGADFYVNLFDFNNTTGIISNHSQLQQPLFTCYGLEFSSDGSKLYAGENKGLLNQNYIYQWDICAGSSTDIDNSIQPLPAAVTRNFQIAQNGKIYAANNGISSLHVINNPNLSGAACNLVLSGQSISPSQSSGTLPNYIKKMSPPPASYSYSPVLAQGCFVYSYTANLPSVNCANSNFSVVSVQWDFGDPNSANNTSNLVQPIHNFSNAGTYTTKLIVYYKCTSDTIQQIIVVPPPNVSVTWLPTCLGNANATVTAAGGVGPYSFLWVPTQTSGSVHTGLNPGSYTVVTTDLTRNCTVSKSFTVPPIPIASFSINPSGSFSICSGKALPLSLIGNCTTYSISPTVSATISNSLVTLFPINSGNYTLTGTLNSCLTTNTVQINVLPAPIVSITADRLSVCINSSLTLVGSGGITYKWSRPSGVVYTSPIISEAVTSLAQFGTYYLEATDINGCAATASIVITQASPPNGVTVCTKVSGCIPYCTDFFFDIIGSTQGITQYWSLNRTQAIQGNQVCVSSAGASTLVGTITDTITACTSTTSIILEGIAPPDARISYLPKDIYENGEDVLFFNSSQGKTPETCQWNVYSETQKKVLRKAADNQFTYQFVDAGTYLVSLEVQNEAGCIDTVLKKIDVLEDFHVWAPNSFTPNNDQLNDVWRPVYRGLRRIDLKIFSRWGELIYQSNNLDDLGWNGTYKGSEVEQGAYNFLINCTTNSGAYKTFSGVILLIK